MWKTNVCVCGACKHFHKHYIKRGKNNFLPLDRGHHVHPRLKHRESDSKACEHGGQMQRGGRLNGWETIVR